MALWDDELEGLRPQLVEEAATFIASMPWRQSGTDGMEASMGGPPSEHDRRARGADPAADFPRVFDWMRERLATTSVTVGSRV